MINLFMISFLMRIEMGFCLIENKLKLEYSRRASSIPRRSNQLRVNSRFGIRI